MSLSISEQFVNTIKERSLFSDEDGLLLAVSGGIDSMCLLHLIKAVHNGVIEVAHMNYQLRGEDSNKDEELVRNYCEQMKIPCHIKVQPLDPDESGIQEKAREFRYQWLFELLRDTELDYIVTAHHFDDQLETSLHHYIRGSGINGIRGMQMQHENLLRPMLSISKADILQYQKKHQVPYRQDATNAESKYTRNFLRNEVLPIIRSHFKHLDSGVKTSIDNLWREKLLLDFLLKNWIQQFVIRKDNYIYLPLHQFRNNDIGSPLLFHLCNGQLNQDEIRQLLESDQAGSFIEKDEFGILKDRDTLVIRPYPQKLTHIKIDKPGTYKAPMGYFSIQEVDKVVIDDNPYCEYIAVRSDIFPIYLRNWEKGDKFYPLGMQGKQKNLSDLFIDEKLNQFQKEEIPILQHNNEIVWVVGLRLSDKYKLREIAGKTYKLTFSISRDQLHSEIFQYLS